MKKIISIALIAAVALFFLSLIKDGIVKAAIQKTVNAMTGLELKMGVLSTGLARSFIQVKDLRLSNPPAFQDPVMIHLHELYIDYELKSIVGGKTPHLEEVRIALDEFYVIRNARGELNLQALKPRKSKQTPEAQGPAVRPPEAGAGVSKRPEVQIDRLHLKIGKVIYKDYSLGGEPVIREFPLNLDEYHENITEPNALVAILVGKAVLNTTLARLARLDAEGLISNLDVSGAALKEAGLGRFEGVLAEKIAELQGDIDTPELREKAGKAVKQVTDFLKGLGEE